MRPGLGESIEPSAADGGNVGARPGVEPCSGGLELVELGRIGSNWVIQGLASLLVHHHLHSNPGPTAPPSADELRTAGVWTGCLSPRSSHLAPEQLLKLLYILIHVLHVAFAVAAHAPDNMAQTSADHLEEWPLRDESANSLGGNKFGNPQSDRAMQGADAVVKRRELGRHGHAPEDAKYGHRGVVRLMRLGSLGKGQELPPQQHQKCAIVKPVYEPSQVQIGLCRPHELGSHKQITSDELTAYKVRMAVAEAEAKFHTVSSVAFQSGCDFAMKLAAQSRA
eukprot:scaffold106954_cov37-Phaeocystis_antarctica.AAC.1